MTWGQLRFQLLQTMPGIPLDLLDEWLNSRYEQVLEAGDWTGIHARSTLTTTAAYQTGTVTLTVGSAAVVGAGTTWAAGIVGQKFYRAGDIQTYGITARADGTHLTLDRNYEGPSVDAPGVVYPAASYTVMQNVYTLPADCRAVERILSSLDGFPLVQFTPGELDSSVGPRATIGDPECFAEIEDQPEVIGTAPLPQVELYPPPRLARGLAVEYLRDPFKFNGLNLTQSPLPFISQSVLLFGARADIAMWQGKAGQAQMYEAKFQEELTRLLRVEHTQRRAKPTLRMADRFTRHRLARVLRGKRHQF